MNNMVFSACFGAAMSLASVSSAATLGLVTDGPVNTGSGGVFFDAGSAELADDFGVNDIVLSTGPLSGEGVSFSYGGGPGFDTLTVNTATYDIVDFGFTDQTIEFELASGADFAFGALFTLTSQLFDFSGSDPFSFFTVNAVDNGFGEEYLADVNVTLQGLQAPAAVPLPAGGLLIISALGALAVARARRKAA